MISLNELGFLDALAAKTPTPAGGAAAAYAGAMAASLVILVARVTIGKQKDAELDREMGEIIAEMERCRAQLVEAVDLDSAAFVALLAAKRLPAGSARAEALLQATRTAVDVPFQTAEIALRVFRAAVEVARRGNPNALNDAICAAWLAERTVGISALNALANRDDLLDPAQAGQIDLRNENLLQRVDLARGQMAELVPLAWRDSEFT